MTKEEEIRNFHSHLQQVTNAAKDRIALQINPPTVMTINSNEWNSLPPLWRQKILTHWWGHRKDGFTGLSYEEYVAAYATTILASLQQPKQILDFYEL